jgi:tetratricopeptide (TPR) repeat protein
MRRSRRIALKSSEVPGDLPEADAVLLAQARVCAEEGRTAEAIAAYRQMLRRQPDWAEAWSELAVLFRVTEEGEHAVAAYRHLVRLRPNDAVAWSRLGALLQELGRPAEAIPALRDALRLDAEMALAWHALGTAYRSQGQHREAFAAFQQAVRFDPDLAQAWYRLGNLYEHYEEYPEAIGAYREAVRSKWDYAVAWYSLAILCRDEGRLQEAVDGFLEGLHIKPHDTDMWLGLGITYARQRNKKGLLNVYEQLAVLDPTAAQAFASQYVDRWTPAPQAPLPLPPRVTPRSGARDSSRNGEVHPLAETWYEIGVLHRGQGEAAEAISDFAEAVRIDPDHAKAWFTLASLYRVECRYEEALQALREVLRIKPGLAVAWRDLATIQARRGRHQKALRAFRKVVQLAPEDLEGWRGLGRSCMALDDMAGLAEVMERVRALSPACAESLANEYAATAGDESTTAHDLSIFEPRPAPLAAAAKRKPASAKTYGRPPLVTTSCFDTWLSSVRRPAVHAGN